MVFPRRILHLSTLIATECNLTRYRLKGELYGREVSHANNMIQKLLRWGKKKIR